MFLSYQATTTGIKPFHPVIIITTDTKVIMLKHPRTFEEESKAYNIAKWALERKYNTVLMWLHKDVFMEWTETKLD